MQRSIDQSPTYRDAKSRAEGHHHTSGHQAVAGAGDGPSEPARLKVEDAFVADTDVVDINAPLSVVVLEGAKLHIGAALVTGHGRLSHRRTDEGWDAGRS